jgi:hypothetical protein
MEIDENLEYSLYNYFNLIVYSTLLDYLDLKLNLGRQIILYNIFNILTYSNLVLLQ